MAKTPSSAGFQPRTTPAERRADIDVQRQINQAVKALRDEVFYTRRFRAFWQYSNTATPPPGAGQLRSNVPLTHFYMHRLDADGYNREVQFDFIPRGALIRVRGTSGAVFEVRTNGVAVDNGDWYAIPVSVISGTAADKGFRVEITCFTGIWSENPP